MSINVLVVDDSLFMRNMIVHGLQQAGLKIGWIYQASDGVQALQYLSTHQIDLVLSDINMPHMNGIEFLRRMKEIQLPKSVPIVVISAESCDEIVQDALAAGASHYIQKPFTPEQIRDRLSFLANS